MRPPVQLSLGDVLELRKPHACGAKEWEVLRLGADIRLACRGCGRQVMLPRSKLERRIVKITPALGDSRSEGDADPV